MGKIAVNLEITRDTLSEFKDIQETMLLAREENAPKTYANLKKRYLFLKALLGAAGINLTDIDIIKE